MDDPWERWEQVAASPPGDTPDAIMPLYAFGWLRSELNNGGFHQLFFNSAGDVVPDAVVACRAVGLSALAALVERAMLLFGEPYPTERQARVDALHALTTPATAQLNTLTDEYYDLEASVDLDGHMRELISDT